MENMKSRPEKGAKSPSIMDEEIALYLGLINATLQDVACVISSYSDAERLRDFEEIRNRTNAEGICFLTKTLPSFGRAIDKALSSDTQLQVFGFKLKPNTKLPRFLGAVSSYVFSAEGWERSDACPLALKALRQVLYLFYKLNVPTGEELDNEVIEKFLETERDLATFEENVAASSRSAKANPNDVWTASPTGFAFRAEWQLRYAASLIKRVLAPTDPLVDLSTKHGPGAVATGEKAWEKPKFRRFYTALNAVFPYDRFFYYNLTHLCDELQEFQALEHLETGTAKVVLVPKDSRGPRLISCEPLEYQWIQQGLMVKMVKIIENHSLTAGYVNFTDQSINRGLALQASSDGRLATLDMKDASDRVSVLLVKRLFPQTWVDALLASRSTHTRLPDSRTIELRKFAPMGSAVCFPVEALVFWALARAVLAYDKQDPRIGRNTKESPVYVYGDDIICDIKDQDIIRRQFEAHYGLRFNESKCCVGKTFRESCGCDAFKGVDVTPLKLRATWSRRLSGMAFPSYVAFHNAMNDRGYFNTCDFLAGEIQKVRRTPYSETDKGSLIALVDCRKKAVHENRKLKLKRRYNAALHRFEYYSWTVRPRLKKTGSPGWAEMQYTASMRPYGFYQDMNPDRLAPAWDIPSFLREGYMSRVVTACQYALPRQAFLRRGWGTL